jgi:hypothetical protein
MDVIISKEKYDQMEQEILDLKKIAENRLLIDFRFHSMRDLYLFGRWYNEIPLNSIRIFSDNEEIKDALKSIKDLQADFTNLIWNEKKQSSRIEELERENEFLKNRNFIERVFNL